MDDNYLYKMRRLENSYLDYVRTAADVRAGNKGAPSREECVWLQKAAACQSEMANLSVGEERRYHQRKLREISLQIQDIVRELDPDAFKSWEKSRSNKDADSSHETGSSGNANKGTGNKTSEDESDTSDWFQDSPVHSFSDVAGMDAVKDTLMKCVNDTKTAKLRSYMKQPALHSFFFYGPPGCGKTYLIEAFVHELMEKDYRYLTLDGSRILSKYVGEAEKIVTRLFTLALENAPCIVFIDEIDGVCKNRSLPNLPEYASSITTSFLTGYNRLQSTEKPVIFIGATNYPEQVDSAMLDRVELIRIPLPDEESRKHLFMHEMKDIISLGEDLTWDYISKHTEGYNARDLKRLAGRLKGQIEKEVIHKYREEERAIQALKSGEFKLNGKLLNDALSEYHPAPKDNIMKALDEWESAFRNINIGEENLVMPSDKPDLPEGPILNTIGSMAGQVIGEAGQAISQAGGIEGISELIMKITGLTTSITALAEALKNTGLFGESDEEYDEGFDEDDAPEEPGYYNPDGTISSDIPTEELLFNPEFDPENL